MFVDDGELLLGFADILFGLSFKATVLGDGGKLASGVDKKCGDEDRLGNFAIFIGSGLEALAGSVREAVEVEAVVPVGAADEREAVWAEAGKRVVETALEVIVERLFRAGLVVELDRLVEDAPVACFFEVGADAEYEPVRIVVESATDVVVAALGEGLELVICAASGLLC